MKKILCMCLLSTQLFAQDYVSLVKDYHQDKLTVQETLEISDIKNKHWKPVYNGFVVPQERDVESRPFPIYLNSILILSQNKDESGKYLIYNLADPIDTDENHELLDENINSLDLQQLQNLNEDIRKLYNPLDSQNLVFVAPNKVQFKLLTAFNGDAASAYDNISCVKVIEHEDFPEVLICKVLKEDASEIFSNYWVLTGR